MVSSPDTAQQHDFEVGADEAFAIAPDMPPGPERIDALKSAGQLRNVADAYGFVFARRGRLPND